MCVSLPKMVGAHRQVHPIIPILHRKTFQADLDHREDRVKPRYRGKPNRKMYLGNVRLIGSDAFRNHCNNPSPRPKAVPEHHSSLSTAPRLRSSMREYHDGRKIFTGCGHRVHQVSLLYSRVWALVEV
jgi:hypothetical protein